VKSNRAFLTKDKDAFAAKIEAAKGCFYGC